MATDDDDTVELPLPHRRHTPSANQVLYDLERYPDGYRGLLGQHGSIAPAAHWLASIRLLARGLAGPPSGSDLHAAALEIATRAGGPILVPTRASLTLECLRTGLHVAHH